MTANDHHNKLKRRKGEQIQQPQYRSLQLLNAYRLVIAGLLFFGFNLIEINFIRKLEPSQWFFMLSTFYLCYAILAVLISLNRLLTVNQQVHLNVLVDVISIALFTLIAGGINSGWGTLILAPIAGASLLLPGQTALLFASYGAVALIIQEFYGDMSGMIQESSYSQTSLLGIALFATALLAITLAKRVSESTALAEKRGIDLANLAQLNDYLINCIESGIIVVDEDTTVKLMNRAAIDLLATAHDSKNIKLSEVSSPLYGIYNDWRRQTQPAHEGDHFQMERQHESNLRVHITKVGFRAEDRGSVIYLSDCSEIDRQVEQGKLASLGRLTASIAHEIRNPLGAISHAAQLLDESSSLARDNKRLAVIISDQSKRLNKIIESILRLSRKDSIALEAVLLQPWLEKFTTEFGELSRLPPQWCALDINNARLAVYTDTNHLYQVLWNLCANAVKYADNNQYPITTVKTHTNNVTGTSYLDIIDTGPGIAPEDQEKLFEPFYTTSSTGTGLGLYISKELCLSNGGDLSYMPFAQGGSCFRIRFAKKQNV